MSGTSPPEMPTPRTNQPPAASRRQLGLASLAVALIALATYAVTLGHGFVFDDGPEVLDNVHIRSPAGAVRILSAPAWSGAGLDENPMYRPATALSYAADHGVWGLAPFGFHLTNVLLHALVSVLVLFLGVRCGLTLPGALLASAVFATLPVHVEAVANVAGRKELLVSAFSIGAVLAHDRAMRRGGPATLLPPLLVVGALFSKESGLAVVGLVAAFEIVFGRARWRQSPGRTAALFACYLGLAIAFVATRHAVLGTLVFPRTPFDENPIASASASIRIMTAVAVLGRGLLLVVAPVILAPDYSFAAILPVTSPLDPAFLFSLLALAGLALGSWQLRGRCPVCGFAVLWYLAAVLPGSNLIVPIGTIFGERLLYLPSVAVTLVAGAAFAVATGGQFARAWRVGAAVLVVAGGVRSYAYARAWSDEPTLFETGVRSQPASSKAWRMYGGSLMDQGRAAEGEAAFRRAADILDTGHAPNSIPGFRSGGAGGRARAGGETRGGRTHAARRAWRSISATRTRAGDWAFSGGSKAIEQAPWISGERWRMRIHATPGRSTIWASGYPPSTIRPGPSRHGGVPSPRTPTSPPPGTDSATSSSGAGTSPEPGAPGSSPSRPLTTDSRR